MARREGLVSDGRFVVDGTALEAWASQKSFRAKGEDKPKGDFRGEERRNETRQSLTDLRRGFRKGKGCEARLTSLGHLLMDARHGLPVGAEVSRGSG